MWDRIAAIFSPKPTYAPGPSPLPRLLLAESCLMALSDCMAPEMRRRHEGVAYLLGQTNGTVTLAISALRPQAVTTRGSFSVSTPAMAQVVRVATKLGLQVVGQVHSHPGLAYHSDGDVEGARIAYRGFVSIVLPDYGSRLPALDGAAVYMFQGDLGFADILPEHVGIIPGRLA
jgi:proteasome lid subunit RPN8/RPN11